MSARAELPQQYKDELDIALVQEDLIAGKPVSERIQVLPTMDSSAIALETGDLETGDLETGDLQIGELEQPLLEQPVIEQAELTLGEPAAPAAPEIIVIEKVTAEEEGTPVPQRRVVLADQSYEVQADENLWDISKRLTGDATNWRDLAALNSLDNNGTVYIGQTLHVPGDMLRQPEQPTLAAALPATDGQSETETTAATKLEAVEAVSEIVVVEATQPELDAGPSTFF